MPSANIATGSFPSRKEANQAVQRLVSAGFARNSIDVHRHEDDEGYDVQIHTRRENVRRAERLIHGSTSLYSIGRTATGVVRTAKSYPYVLLGAGVLAGFLIYSLIPRETSGSSRGNQHSRRRR